MDFDDMDFNELVSIRRKEFWNQLYDKNIDKKGGYYEVIQKMLENDVRSKKFINFENVKNEQKDENSTTS